MPITKRHKAPRGTSDCDRMPQKGFRNGTINTGLEANEDLLTIEIRCRHFSEYAELHVQLSKDQVLMLSIHDSAPHFR